MTKDLAALVAQATSGPWKWWTSNSWKRLSSEAQEGGVICPFVSRDGHPDLTVSEADARLIAMAPDLAHKVLEQQAEIARLTARAEKAEAALSESHAREAALHRALPAASQPEAEPVASQISTIEAVYSNMPDVPNLPDAYQPRNIAAELRVYRAVRPAPAPVVSAEGLTVERVEMEDWSMGYAQPADPIWRIVVGGQCADFPTESAARNFADAISALRSAPPVGARVTDWQPISTAPKDGVTEVLMYDPDLGMAVWPSANSPWPNVTHWMPLPEPPAALLPAGEGE